MKKLILTIMLAFIAMPAMAADPAVTQEGWLKPVESKYVCMVNNTAFDREQIAVEVDGKTYYGCCAMCKDRLQKDASIRTATDPVSGQKVDKATAVIGAGTNHAVYYFENRENLQKFASGPAPEMSGHMEGMGGMMGDGMMMSPEEMENRHGNMMSFDETGNHAPQGTGIVNNIMPDQNKVNVTHEPIAALQWPEMTMDFLVNENVDLSAFKTGDTVMFSLQLGEDKVYRITDMHKMAEESGRAQ